MSFSLPSRKLTWLITGCSSGFGLSLTRFVQEAGHKVIATSRNPSRTPDLVADVESKGGQWIQLDVTDPNSSDVITQLEAQGDRIDVLVNNAGYSVFSPIELASEDEVRAQMDVLYFGPMRLIRTMVPYMRKRRFGTIVNMSSGASLNATETMGVYAGGKAGLDASTKVLAKEVEKFNIRTLTVVLGTFNTGFLDTSILGKTPLPDDYKDTMAEKVLQIVSTGELKPNGDKDKAMKALYEVVVGEGVGKGHEQERLLLLGSDMTARAKGVLEYLGHALEVFGPVTNGVDLDAK